VAGGAVGGGGGGRGGRSCSGGGGGDGCGCACVSSTLQGAGRAAGGVSSCRFDFFERSMLAGGIYAG
jgi:hypothetical protein